LKIKLLVFTVLVLKFDLKTFSGDYNIKKYRNKKKNLVIIASRNTKIFFFNLVIIASRNTKIEKISSVFLLLQMTRAHLHKLLLKILSKIVFTCFNCFIFSFLFSSIVFSQKSNLYIVDQNLVFFDFLRD